MIKKLETIVYPVVPENWDEQNELQFNKFIADNISLIANIIGYENIEYVGSEVRNNDQKRLDILAKTVDEDDERYIAIESQLSITDVNHFSRLLMYMATISEQPTIGVWIAQNAEPSVIQTVEWLNNRLANCDLYVLKAINIQVGTNKGLGFQVLVKPNTIAKKINTKKQDNISKIRQSYERFWELFTNKEEEKEISFGTAGRGTDSWARLFSKYGFSGNIRCSNNQFNINIETNNFTAWDNIKEEWCNQLSENTSLSWKDREGGQKNKVYFIETIINNQWNTMDDNTLSKEIEKVLDYLLYVQKLIDNQ